jgi:hypothetical protein
MREIQAGEGYRLIDNQKDRPMEGDEHYHLDGWRKRSYPSHPFTNTDTYRRRIPAKPEALDIWNAFEVGVGSGVAADFVIRQMALLDEWDVVIGNAAEARQLADWLMRFADWREAQDAGK